MVILLLGGALIYRSKRVSGTVSFWPVIGMVLALALVVIGWLTVGKPVESVTIYPDRIVSASGVIQMRTVTGVHIQSDVSIGRVAGVPVGHSHRLLIADTNEGMKVVASDELFDIEEIQNLIRDSIQQASPPAPVGKP
jgi:hypothetical protein